jgi:hypothetical protein
MKVSSTTTSLTPTVHYKHKDTWTSDKISQLSLIFSCIELYGTKQKKYALILDT